MLRKMYISLWYFTHLLNEFGAASALPERKSDRIAAECRCRTRIYTFWWTGAGLISPDRGINIAKSSGQRRRNMQFVVILTVALRH